MKTLLNKLFGKSREERFHDYMVHAPVSFDQVVSYVGKNPLIRQPLETDEANMIEIKNFMRTWAFLRGLHATECVVREEFESTKTN